MMYLLNLIKDLQKYVLLVKRTSNIVNITNQPECWMGINHNVENVHQIKAELII